MRTRLLFCLAVWATTLTTTAANAADNVLLIQMQPGSQYKVWHTEGESMPTDDEVMTLEVEAKPEGSAAISTAAGPARAFATANGVTIQLPDAKTDTAVLVDRDSCGHIRLWHAAGTTNLTEEQITDIYMSATAEGGKRIAVGDWNVKAFITQLGVTATLWRATKK